MTKALIDIELSSPPNFIEAVSCLIRNEHNKVLLVRRALEDSNKPGLWEIPGGKIDSGESLIQAAVREVKEETQLEITKFFQNRFSNCWRPTVENPLGRYFLTTFVAEEFHGKIKVSDEHCCFAWVSPSKLSKFNLTSETRLSAQALLL